MTDLPALIDWARGLGPSAGATSVIAFDGRSGAGKSTVARAVADGLGAPLFQLEDLYPGWDGLVDGVAALRSWVLLPLSLGKPVTWRKWDWAGNAYGQARERDVGPRLVVEGVGAGARSLAPFLAGVVWVEAPADLRRSRALARDGATYEPHWERWARQESDFYAADDVRSRADLCMENGA